MIPADALQLRETPPGTDPLAPPDATTPGPIPEETMPDDFYDDPIEDDDDFVEEPWVGCR